MVILFIFSFGYLILNSLFLLVDSKLTCSVGKGSVERLIYNNNISKRKLNNNNFEEIRIYISTEHIRKQIESYFYEHYDTELLSRIFLHLNNAKTYIEKLIKIQRRNDDIVVSEEDQTSQSKLFLRAADTILSRGVDSDLVIIPSYHIDNNYDFSITNYLRDESTDRVILSKLIIPAQYLNNEIISAMELEILLFHEITHILGFTYDNFQYFKDGIDQVFYQSGSKYYIISPNVVKLAKEYYGCDSDTFIGLPLEIEKDSDSSISACHWDSKILLGEVMNKELYTPEVVISEFTLALLEDSGWYEVNYFTGGLMRFGKNKGCDFLKYNCATIQYESKYKNEFFDLYDINKPSCSSGRLSRTYCDKTINYNSCPVFYYKEAEEQLKKFIGSCSIGNGEYGINIEYNNGLNIKNGDLEKYLGEEYSNNSFCVLSEIINTDINSAIDPEDYEGIVHPICYEMFCSDKSLTIKIKDEYIVCPREGGKIEIFSSNISITGNIYCPDYNLICTGTAVCNNIFDCIKKQSLPLKPDYTYKIKDETSSQKISQIKNLETIEGYELSNNNSICPLNCAQCKVGDKCTKCRKGFNLIGNNFNDSIICDNETNISSGYYMIKDVSYPCFENCETCNNFYTCEKCDSSHLLNKNKTICHDIIPYCGIYNDNDFSCEKCVKDYAFLKNERKICQKFTESDKKEYYSNDGDISFYPCDTKIKNCIFCENKDNWCSKCQNNYYFLENNHTYCFSDINLTKYYTNDTGISYQLCNKSIPNCDKCSFNYTTNSLKCDICEKNYYFIKEQRNKCYTNYPLDEYYTEDMGVSYYPCDTLFPNCEKCFNNKTNCEKCKKNYYFLNNGKTKCQYISDNNLDLYYTEDNYISLHHCYNSMPHCNKCINKTFCSECFPNYYFKENIRNRCFDLNLSYYYKKNDAYYPCNSSISNCLICSEESSCSLCDKNYYFISTDRTQCHTGLDLKKYFTLNKGISYFKCDTALPYCDECNNNNKICNLCYQDYVFRDDDKTQCFLEENLFNNKSYYKYNDTLYIKCNNLIPNCDTCINERECTKCFNNFYFVDDDKTKCINIKNIDTNRYYKYDENNYHICSSLITNCDQCNSTHCTFCKKNYTLVNNNYNRCYPSENYKIGYYLNALKNMYLPCIDNCDICENGNECLKCTGNYSLFGSGKSCGSCLNFIFNINDELNQNTVDNLILQYINDYKDEYDITVLYVNPYMNYNILFYRTDICTEMLLRQKYFKINSKELNDILIKRFNKKGNEFIYYMIIYNYNTYFGVYDVELNKDYDINKECPSCIRAEYDIENNYIFESNNLIGDSLAKIVNDYSIDILNNSEPYFNDICLNMNIKDIDITLDIRRNLFYYGDYLTKIACLDENCNINDISYEDNLAKCKCKFNFISDKLYLQNNNTKNDINNENSGTNNYNGDINKNFKSVSSTNPFPIFTCSKQSFNSKNIKSNIGFYIGIVIIFIQIIFFLILFISLCIKKNYSKKIFLKNEDDENIIREGVPNPPLKDLSLKKKYSSSEDKEKKPQDKDSNDSISFNENADEEKKVQDKDEDEEYEEDNDFFEDVNMNDINSEININLNNFCSGIDNNLNNTHLLSEENSFEFNSDKKDYNNNNIIINNNQNGIILKQKKIRKFYSKTNNTNLDKYSKDSDNSKISQNLKNNSKTNVEKNSEDKNMNISKNYNQEKKDKNNYITINTNNTDNILINNKNNENNVTNENNNNNNIKKSLNKNNNSQNINSSKKSNKSLIDDKKDQDNINTDSNNINNSNTDKIKKNNFLNDSKNSKDTKNKNKKNMNNNNSNTSKDRSHTLSKEEEENEEEDDDENEEEENEEENEEEEDEEEKKEKENKEEIKVEEKKNKSDGNIITGKRNSDSLLINEKTKKNKSKKNNTKNTNKGKKIENINNSKTNELLTVNKAHYIDSSNNLKEESSRNHQNTSENINEEENNDKENSKISKDNLSKSYSLKSSNSDELYSSSYIKEIKYRLKYDYIPYIEAKKRDKRSFCDIYCHLLVLKQPILDVISDINFLEFNKSFVSFSMKVIRELFYLSLNIFLNSLFLTQNYFEKKYIFFDEKYNLINFNETSENIKLNEKIIYAIKHTYIYAIIIFLILSLLIFIINYNFFNMRKKVYIIIKQCKNDEKEEIKELNAFLLKYNCYFIIISGINFIFMILFFFYMINFSEVYKGGYIDYITSSLLTWAFLQIFPFITCFISSIFRYCGIHKKCRKLYKLNQVYIF